MVSSRAYLSGCRLDTTTLFLPASSSSVRDALRAFPGVRLERDQDASPDEHPLWIELALVRDARPAAESLSGWDWARAYPSLWPRGQAPAFGATAGLLWAGRLWTEAAKALTSAWSAGVSVAVGTYHEVMIGVPNVHLAEQRRGPFTLVLGMYTDSPLAKWGDEVLRSGYRKRLARVSRSGFGDYSVARGGVELLTATMDEGDDGGWRDVATMEEVEPFRSRLEQPLLGYLGRGEYALSTLRRSFAPDVRGRSVRVEILATDAFAAVLPPGRHVIRATQGGYGALQFAGLPAKLTYPDHVTLTYE